MANLSSLYGSPKKHKQKLPPVNAMFGLSSDHFDSEIFHGRNNFNGSFVCEESLQESPSTSNSFFPLREIQPNSQRFRQQLHHVHSAPVISQNFLLTSRMKTNSSTTSLITSSKKRKQTEALLDRPQRQYVCAKIDRIIHANNEALQKLLKTEMAFLPDFTILKKIQIEISLDFRRNCVIWLEDVCLERKTEVVVFPLAVNFMDRFLSRQFVPKQKLQALASACLLISGKVKAPIPLTVKDIAFYSDGAVTEEELINWEILVISTLCWQFSTPTAYEFLDQLLTRSKEIQEIRSDFRRICNRLQQDETLAALRPSLQAIFCAGFAAVETRDDELIVAIEEVCTTEFNVPIQAFRSGVNRLAALFYGRNSISLSESSNPVFSSDDGFEIYEDEGSPRKIRKISEEPEDDVQNSPMQISPERKLNKLNRSKSAIVKTPIRPAIMAKSHSISSLKRISISDDSGIQSGLSSPDVRKMNSPCSTKKTRISRKSRFHQRSERILNCIL